jgi:hypothetical protein
MSRRRPNAGQMPSITPAQAKRLAAGQIEGRPSDYAPARPTALQERLTRWAIEDRRMNKELGLS